MCPNSIDFTTTSQANGCICEPHGIFACICVDCFQSSTSFSSCVSNYTGSLLLTEPNRSTVKGTRDARDPTAQTRSTDVMRLNVKTWVGATRDMRSLFLWKQAVCGSNNCSRPPELCATSGLTNWTGGTVVASSLSTSGGRCANLTVTLKRSFLG